MLKIIQIRDYASQTKLKRPLFLARVMAGFPSPADDYVENKLDLNQFLIKHPQATFFLKVQGDSMVRAGIHSGDTLIVDRSLTLNNNDIAVVMLNGEFTVKRLGKRGKELFLISENPRFKPIKVNQMDDFEVWGVVIHVIHSFI
ncbi:MAG: translesion error-prone DNA polymerase V autoproteolytic subunit [Candidatus Moranbacteria bacterium]|nr:translesion error-prone DNA polymerase V autoproteolytic subunit [Candidatus Moranbacteria bacterium]